MRLNGPRLLLIRATHVACNVQLSAHRKSEFFQRLFSCAPRFNYSNHRAHFNSVSTCSSEVLKSLAVMVGDSFLKSETTSCKKSRLRQAFGFQPSRCTDLTIIAACASFKCGKLQKFSPKFAWKQTWWMHFQFSTPGINLKPEMSSAPHFALAIDVLFEHSWIEFP